MEIHLLKQVPSILVLTLFVNSLSHSAVTIGSSNWGDQVVNNGAHVAYLSDNDSMQKAITLFASHSGSLEQKFYINTSLLEKDKCDKDSPIETNRMTFNGQAVKMTRFCESYNNLQRTYYHYTPATSRGHKYIVNLFKSSTKPIKLIFENETLYVPVEGFTKVWNSIGGDAI